MSLDRNEDFVPPTPRARPCPSCGSKNTTVYGNANRPSGHELHCLEDGCRFECDAVDPKAR